MNVSSETFACVWRGCARSRVSPSRRWRTGSRSPARRSPTGSGNRHSPTWKPCGPWPWRWAPTSTPSWARSLRAEAAALEAPAGRALLLFLCAVSFAAGHLSADPAPSSGTASVPAGAETLSAPSPLPPHRVRYTTPGGTTVITDADGWQEVTELLSSLSDAGTGPVELTEAQRDVFRTSPPPPSMTCTLPRSMRAGSSPPGRPAPLAVQGRDQPGRDHGPGDGGRGGGGPLRPPGPVHPPVHPPLSPDGGGVLSYGCGLRNGGRLPPALPGEASGREFYRGPLGPGSLHRYDLHRPRRGRLAHPVHRPLRRGGAVRLKTKSGPLLRRTCVRREPRSFLS